MRFVTSVFVSILLLMIWNAEARKRMKICYNAKTCVHDAKEKCGVNEDGKTRRFYDTCDLLEYNCLYGTRFVKTGHQKCEGLPPIESKENIEKKHKLNHHKIPK